MIGKKKRSQPTLFIPGSIEDFIPNDHILKKVNRVLDLSWLPGEVADTYCEDNGRPGIDPEAAARLMLAGFFQGIVHDRKLMREAQVNLAIRWFAGYSLDEPLPDHSSLTRIRQRWGAERFRRIFMRTVEACVAAGLVGGDTIHVDATLIRADVSWESVTEQWAQTAIEENREEDKPKRGRPATREKHPKKRSVTDPDATFATSCKTFHLEPSFKQHIAVDDAAGIIVDVDVTTGEDSEGVRMVETLDRIETATGKRMERVTADTAYAHPRNYAACEARNTDAIIPPQKTPRTTAMPAFRFKYDATHQCVRCPAGHTLPHRRQTPKGILFRADARVCGQCPRKAECLPPSARARTILIVDGYEALLRARRRRVCWDEETLHWYKRHRWRVEGIHGEAKTQHGLRRAVRRGLANVAIQVFLTASVMNLKRLASALRRFFAPIALLSASEKQNHFLNSSRYILLNGGSCAPARFFEISVA